MNKWNITCKVILHKMRNSHICIWSSSRPLVPHQGGNFASSHWSLTGGCLVIHKDIPDYGNGAKPASRVVASDTAAHRIMGRTGLHNEETILPKNLSNAEVEKSCIQSSHHSTGNSEAEDRLKDATRRNARKISRTFSHTNKYFSSSKLQ